MIKKKYVDFIITAGLMAFGAFGTIYAACTNKKLDKVCKKLNRTVMTLWTLMLIFQFRIQ